MCLKMPFQRNSRRIWKAHLTKTSLFTAREPYSHIHGLGQVLSTFAVQNDDPGASFEPLLHPCGTQKAQKCTPRTKVKKINKKLSKTFEKVNRLDQIRLARPSIWRPLSLQTSLSIGSLPQFLNSNHAESMLSVILGPTMSATHQFGVTI